MISFDILNYQYTIQKKIVSWKTLRGLQKNVLIKSPPLRDIIDKYVYATGETDTLIYSNIKRIEFRFAERFFCRDTWLYTRTLMYWQR